MNCKDYQKQIISYLDGNLYQDKATELTEHLKRCVRCSKAYNGLSSMYKVIEVEKKDFNHDPFMSARVLAKIGHKEANSTESRISLRYITIASLAAAGIVIGILIGSIYSTSNSIDISSSQGWEQLADEYMPATDNNPYSLVLSTNETTVKP